MKIGDNLHLLNPAMFFNGRGDSSGDENFILDLSNHSSRGKTRTKDKYRVVYSDHQRLELEKEFHYSRYITIRRKAELAQTLSLSERQVKIWFQNRRAKERKQKKKEQTGGDVKVIPEVTDHAQVHAQMHPQAQPVHPSQTQAQVHVQPQPQAVIPAQELSHSQTPHLSHTQAHAQGQVQQPEVIQHREEVPCHSPLQSLQP